MNASLLDLTSSTELCRALSDRARRRLFALVSREELSVNELCEVTGLPQPRVSTHLGALVRAGLVARRQSGRRAFFRRAELGEAMTGFVEALELATDDAILLEDRERLARLLAGPRAWPATVAGEMERHYSPGRTWEAAGKGLVGLCDLGRVLDIGAGDGFLAALLAPRAERVVCVEKDPDVAAAAQLRLADIEHAEVRCADAHALPAGDESFDAALIMSSLCYFEDPARVFDEVARVLCPGGTLVVTTLSAHKHLDVSARFGHIQPGFDEGQLDAMLRAAGFSVELCTLTSRERRPPHFEVLTAHARR